MVSRWPLFALVVFIAVLGVCYSLLTRQGFRDGGAAGVGPGSSTHDEEEAEGGDGKSENSYVITDDDETAAAPKIAQRPTPRTQAVGSDVETIEDDEENGEVVDVKPTMDDENGVIEEVGSTAAKPRKP